MTTTTPAPDFVTTHRDVPDPMPIWFVESEHRERELGEDGQAHTCEGARCARQLGRVAALDTHVQCPYDRLSEHDAHTFNAQIPGLPVSVGVDVTCPGRSSEVIWRPYFIDVETTGLALCPGCLFDGTTFIVR